MVTQSGKFFQTTLIRYQTWIFESASPRTVLLLVQYSTQYTSSIVSFLPSPYEICNGLVRCPQHSPTSCHNTASTAAVKVKVVFKDSQIRVTVLLRTLASRRPSAASVRLPSRESASKSGSRSPSFSKRLKSVNSATFFRLLGEQPPSSSSASGRISGQLSSTTEYGRAAPVISTSPDQLCKISCCLLHFNSVLNSDIEVNTRLSNTHCVLYVAF